MAAPRSSGVRQVHATCVNAGQSPAPRNLSRQNSPSVAQTGALLRPGDDAVALKREAERRTLFQKTSNKVLDIPNGYRRVEVLILRWDESIDDFKDGHTQEIQRLESLFSQRLGYGVTVESIKNTRNPQVAFNLKILQHVDRYDDEDTLLIVYYTGHGRHLVDDNVQNLELSATEESSASGNFAPVAFWGQAEEPLRTLATADVLSILDCCCASTAAVKGGSSELRAYQLLAASTLKGYTYGPGKNSFTTAFCDSLEELIEESKGESFSVIQLWERINTKRASDAALIWDRLQRWTRNIDLYRLDSNSKRDASFQRRDPERSSLLLRLSIRTRDLDDVKIQKLARQLHIACKTSGIPVRQLEWVKMEQPNPAKAFRKAVQKVQHQLKRESAPGKQNDQQRQQLEAQADQAPSPEPEARAQFITVGRESFPQTRPEKQKLPDPDHKLCATSRGSIFCLLRV